MSKALPLSAMRAKLAALANEWNAGFAFLPDVLVPLWGVTATGGYHATQRTTVSTRSTLQYLDAADRDRRDELVERNHRYAVERLVACAAIAKKTVSL